MAVGIRVAVGKGVELGVGVPVGVSVGRGIVEIGDGGIAGAEVQPARTVSTRTTKVRGFIVV